MSDIKILTVTICEIRVQIIWRQPELIEVCTVIQVKFYYMQTVYKYNIGCLYSVYRTQLNLKLSFLTQQGCKLLHFSCIVEFVYCKDKMYCY